MSIPSTGDLARSFFLRQSHERARGDLSTLTEEMASGTHADMGRALKGDFTALAGVERGLRLFESYKSAAAEATLTTGASQAALQTVQDSLSGLAPELLSATASGSLQQMDLMAASAPDRLSAMVSALNQSAAGRSLFAGAATDRNALAPVADITAALEPLAAGAVDAADLITTLESWFMDPGGGFETLAYQGNPDGPPGVLVAEGETVQNPASALDPGLRRGLMGMALAALVATDAGSFPGADKRALLEHAALSMTSGNEGITGLRARIGHAEGRIEAAQLRNDTARGQLELERGRLTGVDPYRTATELQQAEARLESLYLLTSRLARLSLTEYLR